MALNLDRWIFHLRLQRYVVAIGGAPQPLLYMPQPLLCVTTHGFFLLTTCGRVLHATCVIDKELPSIGYEISQSQIVWQYGETRKFGTTTEKSYFFLGMRLVPDSYFAAMSTCSHALCMWDA